LVLARRQGVDEAEFEQLLQVVEASLAKVLGGFFAAPVLKHPAPAEEGRLARQVLDQSEPWQPAYPDPATGKTVSVRQDLWRRLERRLSKETWLDRRSSGPPWDLAEGAPTIVTFYSFKGGVGRTTALVSCAWQIARSGKRAVAVDLDLEAPGLGLLLEAGSVRGVLDAIVDHLAIGSFSLDGLHAPAQALGARDAASVEVFPAGELNDTFLEKLARLDFVGAGPVIAETRSPVEIALTALLGKIRSTLKPDYILIDARAGLHDLAGLSLHGLAHVDVLVSRATEQGYRGLDVTVQALSRRKDAESLKTVVVHAFAPRDPASPIGEKESSEFLERSHQIFTKYVYDEESAEDLDVETAAHFPSKLPYDPDLERFTALASVEKSLLGEDYQALWRRIVELCALPQGDEADDVV
jgi:MinD-like ATPase involved in chromosome partitioning or flagellar assembly